MDAQYGYRKKDACEISLITTIEDIACNLSISTQIDAVFLDLSKAFDRVPHRRLLLKLEYHGIRSNTLQWMCSFLNNSRQCVIVESGAVTSGFLQGTLLGPLLFIFFIKYYFIC